jgi:hypothetical protein
MVGGGVLLATMCRDKKALRACLVAFVIVGLWMAIVLIITMYSGLSGASATDFDEASKVREGLLESNPFLGNANSMAFMTGQGVVVALVMALHEKKSWRRYALFGIIILGIVATFLPLSRSGIVITLVSCATVMFVHKGQKLRVILAAIVLGIAILAWVPDVVFARLTFSTKSHDGKQEARAAIYTAAIEHAPEYVITGVGTGNFWRLWGYNHGWRTGGGTLGAHNSPIAVTLYWGIAGLAAFILVIVQAYRCLPRWCSNDPLALSLLGIGLSMLLLLNVTHNLKLKEFSIGLGLMVAARTIWPNKFCEPVTGAV